MSKKRSTAKKKPYTVVDAAADTVHFVVVAPVWWLFEKTLGSVLDA